MTAFTELIDLASERLGGETVIANDEFFAPKENLLKPGRGEWREHDYTDRGKWMDGWETRRRREPGNDWVIIRLGLPGIVRGVDVDTNHFKGNFPESCSIDGACFDGPVSAEYLTGASAGPRIDWVQVLPKSRLHGHTQNLLPADIGERRLTHVRLNIFPDGGVARFRVYGDVAPDWPALARRNLSGELVDLAAIENGGYAVVCSDMFFGNRHNMLMPGRAPNMGDGWETRRRRGPGHDWCIIRLGRAGTIKRIEIDTNHFKGNYPDRCDIEGCNAARETPTNSLAGASWQPLLPQTKLRASERHFFDTAGNAPATFVRINIYPDGGISRLRLFGDIADAASLAQGQKR